MEDLLAYKKDKLRNKLHFLIIKTKYQIAHEKVTKPCRMKHCCLQTDFNLGKDIKNNK